MMQQTQETMAKIRELEKASTERVQEMERNAGDQLVEQVFFDLQTLSQDIPEMLEYLSELAAYVLDNISLFKDSEGLRSLLEGCPAWDPCPPARPPAGQPRG